MIILHKIFLILIFSSILITSLYGVEISNKVKATIDSNGKLVVNTRYLTNYIFRVKNINNGETDSLVLINRNTKVFNFDMVDLEWDGF